ncbi:hypothetical protein, partial [Anaerobium acetethylicum]|uniref:hypothetical protein n=1 Tax=Anaerobium acetethylicum TaxID=1619234 RepID=UPI001A9A4087
MRNYIMSWLQGGPFLEISIIIREDDVRKIITTLTTLNNVSIIEDNLEDVIGRFEIGYLYDEQDISSQRIHSISLNIIEPNHACCVIALSIFCCSILPWSSFSFTINSS